MLYQMTDIKMTKNNAYQVRFADGTSGIIEFSDSALRGVFAPLKDNAFFAKAKLEYGTITWPNGADLAPDAVYKTFKTTNHMIIN